MLFEGKCLACVGSISIETRSVSETLWLVVREMVVLRLMHLRE